MNEYEVVGRCPRTGRPIMAPRVWNSKFPRPHYVTCGCCRPPREPKKKKK